MKNSKNCQKIKKLLRWFQKEENIKYIIELLFYIYTKLSE